MDADAMSLASAQGEGEENSDTDETFESGSDVSTGSLDQAWLNGLAGGGVEGGGGGVEHDFVPSEWHHGLHSWTDPVALTCLQYVRAREFQGHGKRLLASKTIQSGTAPKSLQSKCFPIGLTESDATPVGVDKVFASAWIDDETVVGGTKDNELLIWKMGEKRVHQPFKLPLYDDANKAIGTAHSAPTNGPLNEGDAAGTGTGAGAGAGAAGSTGLSSVLRRTLQDHCGIHTVSVSPDSSLLVTGGIRAEDVGVFRLPDMQHIAMGVGHKDWVFDAGWVNERHFVTCSRDKSVALWDSRDAESASLGIHGALDLTAVVGSATVGVDAVSMRESTFKPVAHDDETHEAKVRSLTCKERGHGFATLSVDQMLVVWDVQDGNRFSQVSRYHLEYRSDPQCITHDMSRGLYAVGSQHVIDVIDDRAARHVGCFPSLDGGWGVRSLSIAGDVITVGGALGMLSFIDLRAAKYLPVSDPVDDWDNAVCRYKGRAWRGTASDGLGSGLVHEAGAGWIRNDLVYLTYFNEQVRNSIYTHCYDRAGSRLFAAGGPCPYGLFGSYAAVWQ